MVPMDGQDNENEVLDVSDVVRTINSRLGCKFRSLGADRWLQLMRVSIPVDAGRK